MTQNSVDLKVGVTGLCNQSISQSCNMTSSFTYIVLDHPEHPQLLWIIQSSCFFVMLLVTLVTLLIAVVYCALKYNNLGYVVSIFLLKGVWFSYIFSSHISSRGFIFLSSLVQPEHLHIFLTSASQTEMPLCFCAFFNCSSIGGVNPITGTPRGVFSNICLHRQHALKDKKAIFCKVQEDADITLEAQLQEITAQLSAITLADNISGLSTQPGGSLWS